jgi:hypothetical protein
MSDDEQAPTTAGGRKWDTSKYDPNQPPRHTFTKPTKPTKPNVQTTKQKFSEVSKDGTCPKCGGTSFKAKRSGKGKFFAAAGGLNLITMPLAPKSRVKCTTCGTEYKRG